jgi:TatD DNase family protein
VIDFHCHLDLYPNHHEVRQECDRRGMYVLSVTTTPSAWKGTSALSSGSPRIRTALGLHPQLAGERKSELALFDALLPEVRYVGEVGLDGAPEFRNSWKDQVSIFEHILTQCQNVGGRIVTIHSRRASQSVLDCLEKTPGAGTPVLHWFSGSCRDLTRAIDLDCWFSVGPAMLASKRGRSLVAHMPHERVLTETDGPFAQLDGRSIMPWEVKDAIRQLAQIWKVSQDSANETVRNNFRNLCVESPDT